MQPSEASRGEPKPQTLCYSEPSYSEPSCSEQD